MEEKPNDIFLESVRLALRKVREMTLKKQEEVQEDTKQNIGRMETEQIDYHISTLRKLVRDNYRVQLSEYFRIQELIEEKLNQNKNK